MPNMNIPEYDVDMVRKVIVDAANKAHVSNAGESVHGACVNRQTSNIHLPRGPVQGVIDQREEYRLEDFLRYHDETFISNAYLGVLRRPVDPSGFDFYLGLLRKSHLSKIEILGKLRYSREGRQHKVKIAGLLHRFLFRSLCHIPVVGYLLKLLYGWMTLPLKMSNQEEYNAVTSARFQDIYNVNQQTAEILEETLNRLKNRLDGMHFDDELATVRHLLSRTVSMNELEALNRELSTKASSEAVAELAKKVAGKVTPVMLQPLRVGLSEKVGYAQLAAMQKGLSEKFTHALIRLDEQMHITKSQTDERLEQVHAAQEVFASELTPLKLRSLDCSDESFAEMYDALEQAFRGPEDLIKARLAYYIPVVETIKSTHADATFLDLGCGRCEWLETLRDHNVDGIGIDLSQKNVDASVSRGFKVFQGEMLTFLQQQPDAGFAGVTGFHIIEHLPFGIFLKVLQEVARVLKPGGVVIFETPNPDNVLVGSCNFYLDPTHRSPLPWKLTKFILEYCGFSDVDVVELNPSTSSRLAVLSEVDERFNHHFYDAMDYGVIGWKRGKA